MYLMHLMFFIYIFVINWWWLFPKTEIHVCKTQRNCHEFSCVWWFLPPFYCSYIREWRLLVKQQWRHYVMMGTGEVQLA